MKNLHQIIVLSLVVLSTTPASARAEDQAYVQTRSVSVQAEPKLMAKSKKKLSYGDAVSVIGTENGWAKVRSGGTEGYLHTSALSSRSVSLSADKKVNGGVSDSDISLAGKGFSPEIEQQLAAKNGSLNFHGVDAMERVTVSTDQVRAFVKSGNLNQDIL